MVRLDVDFRFVEFTYELWMIEEHIKLIEENLPSLNERGQNSFESALDLTDAADRDLAAHFRHRIEDGIATRVLLYGPVIALWATFEAATAAVTKYGQSERGIKLGLMDIRGPVIERLRKYNRDVLHMELFAEGTDWSALKDLYQIRNVLAHANGRIGDVKDRRSLRRTEAAVKRRGGLEICDGYLVLSAGYVRSSFDLVSETIRLAIRNVRLAFPLKRS